MGKIFVNTTFKPLLAAEERIEASRTKSAETLLTNLLYAGELLTKIITTGMMAGVQRDADRHQYRHFHKLVRASGIGDWTQELDSLLTGTTTQFLNPEILIEQQELILRAKHVDEWQYQAVQLMHQALSAVYPSAESLPKTVSCRTWFALFAQLRNKTRGHGAVTEEQASAAVDPLERSIHTLAANFSILKRPWVHLHRSLSNKYNVTWLNDEAKNFKQARDLAGSAGLSVTIEDGLYLWLDKPVKVEIAWYDQNGDQLYFPNGGFNERTFEVLSYETNSTKRIDSAPYLLPPGSLPDSETQGLESLEVIGGSFSNLPDPPQIFISRPDLQDELTGALTNSQRYSVVVLHGRGGIGKTSLALQVLHDIEANEQYECILWFSARDVDLLPEGPKLVRAHLVSEDKIAKEYARLVLPQMALKSQQQLQEFEKALGETPLGKPVLFVFDNFETVQNPLALFKWVDTHLRPPNKVLITTRIKDFKATYDIEVQGMLDDEAYELIDVEAERLGIEEIVDANRRRDLAAKADGHPYIIKVLLGEVARQRKWVNIERMVADQESILTALFERTYNHLTPLAKRIFLTASQWKSVISVLSFKMVLLRNATENLNVQRAIDELTRSSLIEIISSKTDQQDFVSVPLAAAVFGRSKMVVEAISSTVTADLQLLQDFGAAQRSNVAEGISPRIKRFFSNLQVRIRRNEIKLEESVAMLELAAHYYPYAWVMLADLYKDSDLADGLAREREALQRYIQTEPQEKATTWARLAFISNQEGAAHEEAHALLELVSLPHTSYQRISNAASRITSLIVTQRFMPGREEKNIFLLGVAQLMHDRISEADSTDCSRLAWLYLKAEEPAKAREIVDYGLHLDSNNEHLIKLSEHPFYVEFDSNN